MISIYPVFIISSTYYLNYFIAKMHISCYSISMEALLINFLCASVLNLNNFKSQNACNQAAIATSIHYGLRDNFNKIDKNLEQETKYYENKITKDINKGVVLMVGTAYSVYNNKGLNVSTKFKPISDSVSISINGSSQMITFSWSL